MKINSKGIEILKNFEGIKLKPYLDSGNIPTIGIGTTIYENGIRVTMKDPAITVERAEELLRHDVAALEQAISAALTVKLTDDQFSALICLAYNIGIKAFLTCTLFKVLSLGQYDKAADQFLVWNKVNGKVITGLTNRREAERKLFLTSVKPSIPTPTDSYILDKLKSVEPK